MRGGQSWSIDVVIGVVIFLLVIGVFYALLTNSAKEDATDLKIASESVATKLTNDQKIGIITNEAVDKQKLVTLTKKTYLQLKQELGTDAEFCIFFENENGSVINITDAETGNTYIGIGSKKINISGIPCYEVTT